VKRPPFEVAQIIRQQGSGFIERNGAWLTWDHRRALQAIAHCRTSALGGHLDRCSRCDYRAISYNSCLMGSFS
jgi:Transposase zinc-binding domain